MALPPTQFPPCIGKGDVQLFQRLLAFQDGAEGPKTSPGRLLIVGGPPEWVLKFRAAQIEAWRLGPVPLTRYDVQGLSQAVPFKESSMKIVVYGMSGYWDPWLAMNVLQQAIYPLAPFGFFVFHSLLNPLFAKYLDRLGFSRVPLMWRGHEIWQRGILATHRVGPAGLAEIRQGPGFGNESSASRAQESHHKRALEEAT